MSASSWRWRSALSRSASAFCGSVERTERSALRASRRWPAALSARAWVSIISPRYLKSEWTIRELNEFWDAAEKQGGIHVANKARVFKVLKTPVFFLGLSLPEHGYHAPNENYDWQQAQGGIAAFATYFNKVAAMGAGKH